jgi:hypothetical protein
MNRSELARSQLTVAIAVTIALAPTDVRWAGLARALLALVQSLAWPVRVNTVRTGSARATALVARALDAVETIAAERIEQRLAVERAKRVMDHVNQARAALQALAAVSASRAA